jgi:hypothetical protein
MLAISHRKYNNLTWRLDVELARRSMHVMTEPKYMIRLDIEETGSICIYIIIYSNPNISLNKITIKMQ